MTHTLHHFHDSRRGFTARLTMTAALFVLLLLAPAAGMNNPGPLPLGNFAITGAATQVTPLPQGQTQYPSVAGILSLSCQVRFFYGAGGTSVTAYVQTTLDQGQTWIDIAAIGFTTANGTSAFNVSALDKVTTPISPLTDGSLAAGTVISGILGDQLRAKVVSTGTYSSSSLLSVSCEAR